MDLGNNWLLISGGIAALFAVLAWLAETRRMRRVNLDQVGFMPWTGLFFLAILAAIVLFALGVKDVFSA